MNAAFDLNDPQLRDRAIRAALGSAPFDVLIEGGVVANMVTGELRPADVGLVGPFIASVHAPRARSDTAQRVAAHGKIVAPGFIDTHLHIESSMVTPRRYAETVVPQGTTTICWDPHEVANVLGLEGVRWAVEASRNLPLRILVLAPSSVPSAPGIETAGASFGEDEMREMLSWSEVAGVAEVMDMRGVLDRSPRMSGIVQAGLESGKLVCGHARDLSGGKLTAFAVAGIESDHEMVSGADLLEKVRAGFDIELRGAHDAVLPGAVEVLNSLPIMPATLTICTDDVFPDDLVVAGGMCDVLRRLVRYGLDPVQALRAATFNAARRIGRRDLGLVAPGRRADIVLLDDLESFFADTVFVSGEMVANRNRLVVELPPETASLPTGTMRLSPLSPTDFELDAPGVENGMARFRTAHTPRFTRWGEAELVVRDGIALLPDDGLLMAVIHRHGMVSQKPGLGVLQGWGDWRCAIATTVAHDSHNLCVFGRDIADMALAANTLIEAGGGMAVVAQGRVLTVLPLPVCGLVAESATVDVAANLRELRAAIGDRVDWAQPFTIIKAIIGASLACNPGPHVTDLGLTDGGTGEIFGSGLIAE
ncbi:amidohydrolase family protein [Aquamicrobium sp. NLF2-7]|uniref:adenine deaminase n=1 Tax=Aquamicrobium sp. NLF2-7 TaxID=2918753 RepID=UPI001EFB4A82|nr:adenine deaminase C-terminal domain-containing protein [Aquamicrobium sp. NLF2-7]MCG8272721.1 amidohydrolase family protein [Aquamicrobium sp. NLF2-7]